MILRNFTQDLNAEFGILGMFLSIRILDTLIFLVIFSYIFKYFVCCAEENRSYNWRDVFLKCATLATAENGNNLQFWFRKLLFSLPVEF